MTNIYVLKLTHNKYYVGKTKNINNRLLDHFSNNGSVWTKKYKPIKILHIHKNCEPLDEDKYTIKYMSKYGIDNVRGGIYCRMYLNSSEKNIIQRSFKGMNDLCYKCGSNDHFDKDCNKNKKKWSCQYCNRNFDSKKAVIYHVNFYCKKKYKVEEVEVWVCQYCNKEFSSKKGATFHENIHCKKKYKVEEVEVWVCQYCNKEFSSKKGATFHENIHCKKKIIF